MKREQIGTALAMQYMNCDSVDSMDQRVLVQKKFYIAQVLGAKFGYKFTWYLRGPYSKNLTANVYDILSQDLDELDGYELSEKACNICDKVNNLENENTVHLSVSDWYELLASIVFLRDNYGIDGLKDKRSIKSKLKELKPWYTDEQFNVAWEVCGEHING